MDHAKITFPRFQVTNKMTFGLKKLPITLTGMIVHGHGDEHMRNILMSCGQMIPIAQLRHCYVFFEFWKRVKAHYEGPFWALSQHIYKVYFYKTCFI
jgi:hypothetical protein